MVGSDFGKSSRGRLSSGGLRLAEHVGFYFMTLY